ncbi:MAG: SET domain-containing protein-lysine N-methyltransferase [Acidobacteriota bacterium]|nr:MAG: SET domain-containing protein-lysine N-methyltransferase [Acidobacteriota bacterium]
MKRLSYISPKAEVLESGIHGRGLFAKEAFRKGEIVCVKGGYIFERRTRDSMPGWYRDAEIQIGEDLFIGPLTEDEREGSMIFSNHSCDPNIGVRGQIVFVAMRDIEAGEELTHDWATTDDDVYEMECRCGSENCRGVITGKDWQKPEVIERYAGFIADHIAERLGEL